MLNWLLRILAVAVLGLALAWLLNSPLISSCKPQAHSVSAGKQQPSDNSPHESCTTLGRAIYSSTGSVLRGLDTAVLVHEKEVTAGSTAIIGFFTIALACVGISQGLQQSKALRLARDEFLATHRPQMIVRSFERSVNADFPDRIEVRVTFVNAGASKATITEIAGKIATHQILLTPGIPLPHLYRGREAIKIGHELHRTIASEIEDWMVTGQAARENPNLRVFCLGYVAYEDGSGGGRRTGFGRIYDPGSKQWLETKNSNYEYAY